jgi:hypothetical protein
MIMSFPKGSSKELVLKSRVGSEKVESGLKLVYVVLPLDELDSVAAALNNSGNSKDQESAPLSIVGSLNGIGTFSIWSEIASFWRGTGSGTTRS